MKTPDALKADLPPSKWGKILGATPVVLTVVATLLAGLSSSEMTSAQYDRALGAQLQSKAGDQWNYFQGKKLRSAFQHNMLDLIVSGADWRPLEREQLASFLASSSPREADKVRAQQQAIDRLLAARPSSAQSTPSFDPAVQAALEAIDASQPEPEIMARVTKVSDAALSEALRQGQAEALAFDRANKPIGQAIDELEQTLISRNADPTLRRSFTAARLAVNAQRYDSESALNRTVASLYELQVRKANFSAERHHRRSQRFFYGMLAAQTGVIISTLAMAAQNRSFLWSIAAVAGFIAVCFAFYVYFYV